jgi:PTH2 family peptidyl-tRNA hydrolase
VSGTKQVIVMRNDLNMRKGKMVAQGAHAAIKDLVLKFMSGATVDSLDAAEKDWYGSNFKKVCVQADSEEQLLQIFDAATAKGLRVHLITDKGLTEFGGVPTNTCLAVGPHFDEDFVGITDLLRLF